MFRISNGVRRTFNINQSAQKINHFWRLSLFLIFALLGFYIFQLNEITKGMELVKNYDKELRKLSEENKLLEIKFSQLNSMANLGLLVEKLNFDETGKIDYIKIPEGVVATK
ncbi:hypothetical protein KJ636_00050 [Patescibacteria group bacterium]|nr:hypothetical protein [Patescibacteria group bacterium]MBU4481016.1 hypothetical protein [Patescibacteria group bacterium]